MLLSVTGLVLGVILLAAGGLLTWGGGFASNTVRDQLVAQQITFTPAETFATDCLSPLKEWAGKPVDSGNAAKAYSDVIACHMKTAFVGMGLPEDSTYASLSTAARATDPASNEGKTLASAVDLAYKGESLRSILLTAYAFGTIGAVAMIASYVAYGAGLLMLVLALLGFNHARRQSPDAVI